MKKESDGRITAAILSFERPHSPELNEVYNFEIEMDDQTLRPHTNPTKQGRAMVALTSSSDLGFREF